MEFFICKLFYKNTRKQIDSGWFTMYSFFFVQQNLDCFQVWPKYFINHSDMPEENTCMKNVNNVQFVVMLVWQVNTKLWQEHFSRFDRVIFHVNKNLRRKIWKKKNFVFFYSDCYCVKKGAKKMILDWLLPIWWLIFKLRSKSFYRMKMQNIPRSIYIIPSYQ